MSRKIRKIVGVVAAIAIPFAAPVLAGAIAGSSLLAGTAAGAFMGSVAGSALVGGALGLGASALQGGNLGRGALFGALGGGIGGWLRPATATMEGIASMTSDPIGAMAAMSGAPVEAGFVESIGLSQALSSSGAAFSGMTQLADGSVQFGAPTFVNATTGAATSPVPMAASRTPAQMQGFQGSTSMSSPGVSGQQPALGAQASPVAQAASESPTFMQTLQRMPGEIVKRFTDPKALADLTLRAAGQLLGSAVAGSGLSPEEAELLQAQAEDLQALREKDEELFKIRLREAMGLLGEARYFDPNQFGIQAASRTRVSAGLQQREAARSAALRPGAQGLSAADERRAGLETTAAAQTAYLQGHESAQRQRLATYQAGLAALPTGGPTAAMGARTSLAGMYERADERKRRLQEDIGGFFGSLTGQHQAQSIG